MWADGGGQRAGQVIVRVKMRKGWAGSGGKGGRLG